MHLWKIFDSRNYPVDPFFGILEVCTLHGKEVRFGMGERDAFLYRMEKDHCERGGGKGEPQL